jgi:hydrogenase maturation protease
MSLPSPSVPGRVRRCNLRDAVAAAEGFSSHGVDIGRSYPLGRALGRVPDALVMFTIEVADTGHGIGLTPQVAGAVPEVVDMAVAEINRICGPARRSRRPASQ